MSSEKTKKHTLEPRWYPSMAAASAKEGVPMSILKQGKAAGADGCDPSGRIDMAAFLAWFFAQGEENVNWGQRLKRAQALMAEADLERMNGELVRIEDVHSQQRQVVAKARAILTQKFETELPAKEDGMPAVEIATLNRQALSEVFAVLNKKETYS